MSKGKKICIVATSLGKGGAERSSALLSRIVHNLGHEVHFVSVMNSMDYEYEGELLNLGALEKGHSLLSKIRKFRIFKSYLKTNDFDVVIDNRSRPSFLREFIVARLLFHPKKTIYCVRSYNFDTYFIKPKSIARLLYKDAFKIVAVSKDIEKKIISQYGFDNVTTIYNPIEPVELKSSTATEHYILFYGRLVDKVKNISLLIQSYKESNLPEKGIALMLLGDGADLSFFKTKVASLNLSHYVRFVPFTANPYNYVNSALFTVLTSHYEGFPRSIIESLALGVPVISVDCKSGPNEIIQDEINGLLVENYNSKALAEAMNRFIEDKDVYQTCKANAKKSVERFSMESIGQDWQKLLN